MLLNYINIATFHSFPTNSTSTTTAQLANLETPSVLQRKKTNKTATENVILPQPPTKRLVNLGGREMFGISLFTASNVAACYNFLCKVQMLSLFAFCLSPSQYWPKTKLTIHKKLSIMKGFLHKHFGPPFS